MSLLKRRASVGDGMADNDKRSSFGARKRLASMFKSNLSIPAHASFGSPSLSYSPNLSTTTVVSSFHLPLAQDYSTSTLNLSMPRNSEFQGLPTPFFPADAYYWTIADGNKQAKRPHTSKSRKRSSLSSESPATSILTGNDDMNQSSTSTSLARAHSTSAHSSSTRRAPHTTSRKRPSTASSSIAPTVTSDLPTTPLVLPDRDRLPAIAAEDPNLPDPLLTRSTTSHMPVKQFVEKNGKRHHPYSSSKAPYPRSYDSTAIDHDTSTHIFFGTVCKSVTFHQFSTPPSIVLDLGCGTGTWVVESANSWRNSTFVGLDLMPLQPNLSVVAPHLQDRIQWLTANFLDRLPFDDNHFDFVHIRRIARGVPENKWPFLLEEVSRVLKPGGALEVVEEDLIFPGGQEPCTCHYPPGMAPPEDLDEPMSLFSAVSSSHEEKHGNHPLDDAPDTPVPSTKTSDTAHPHFYSSPFTSSRDHSKLEEAYNDMHSSKFINLMPISVLTESLEHYFTDVRSHPPVLVTFPPPEEDMWSDGSASGTERSMTSASTNGPPQEFSTTSPRRVMRSRPSTAESSIGSSGGSPTRSSLAMSPTSPSDARQASESNGYPAGADSTATTATPTGYMTHPPVGGWHTLHVDVRSLVHPRQPFMMIDRCRMPARALGINTPVAPGGDGPPQSSFGPMTRLPNTTFEFDLQSLTLLLSQSVTEVLECSEAIWEYLIETGKARTKKPRDANPSYSLSSGPATGASATSTASQGPVDREEFDHWILKYEKEMHARIGMAEALRRRFGWETKGLSSDYVTERARFPPIQPTTPATTTAPTSASATTPPIPRLLVDPFSDDIPTTEHSSSSTSLAPHEETNDTNADTGNKNNNYTNNNNNNNSGGGGVKRKRTGSAPERISGEHDRKGAGKHVAAWSREGGTSHSRSQSLDAANAWEALHPGAIGIGEGEAGGDLSFEGAGEGEVELPRLSRCIRVFVAWNGKT